MELNGLIDFLKILAVAIGLVVAGINIYKFFWKAPSEKEAAKFEMLEGVDSIASRFIALFESHGVHRHQIPTFFNHGLSIHNCAADDELLKHLTPEMLKTAAELFGVSLDWLEGAGDEIYKIPDFYKDPESFNRYLVDLRQEKPKSEFLSYVLTAVYNKDTRDEYDALFLIVETIGEVNERPVYRYRFSGQWLLRYWKSRGYFTACSSLLLKNGFDPIGKRVDKKWLSNVIDGKSLLEYDYQSYDGDIDFPSHGYWSVSDFVEMPEQYLEGIDAERDNFGRISALDKWLSLSKYMNCFNDESHQQVIDNYQVKLRELKAK